MSGEERQRIADITCPERRLSTHRFGDAAAPTATTAPARKVIDYSDVEGARDIWDELPEVGVGEPK